MTEDQIEAQNALSMWLYEIGRDTPARTWWNLPEWHPAVGRALKIDRQQEGGVYALAPFRLWHDGERHVVLAAHPAPRILGPVDDHLGIETVFAWNPVDNTVAILGDAQPQLAGAFMDADHGAIYESALAFFQAWAINRAAFFVRWCQSRRGEWAHGAVERDEIPGKLIVGAIEDISWRGLPQSLECHGIDPIVVNRMVLRQSNIPRAHNGRTERLAA